jgi:hypothetical protein
MADPAVPDPAPADQARADAQPMVDAGTPASRLWLMVLLPAGAGFAVVGGFMQEHRLEVGALAVPWAAILVIVTLVVTLRALSLSLHTRLAGALFYAGWLIGTALLALPNPSGDVVFTADVVAYGYLLAGTLLGGAAAAWPLFLEPAAAVDTSDSVTGDG